MWYIVIFVTIDYHEILTHNLIMQADSREELFDKMRHEWCIFDYPDHTQYIYGPFDKMPDMEVLKW